MDIVNFDRIHSPFSLSSSPLYPSLLFSSKILCSIWKSPESIYYCLYVNWCRTIYWIINTFRSLKKTDPPPARIHQLQTASKLGRKFHWSLFDPCWDFGWLVLVRVLWMLSQLIGLHFKFHDIDYIYTISVKESYKPVFWFAFCKNVVLSFCTFECPFFAVYII